VHSFFESITSNAVSTFAINANTSFFSPLNGVTNFKASPTEIYSVILAVLLTELTTLASKLRYRLGMDSASTHLAWYDAWVDDTLWTGPRRRLVTAPVSADLPALGLELAPSAANSSLDSGLLCFPQLPSWTVEVSG